MLEFLELPETQLDAGFSRPLQQEALQQGTLALALAFLESRSIQDELNDVISRAQLTSLDVERKHFEDKCFERGQSKIRSINRWSRNSMIRRYRRQRTLTVRRKVQKNKIWQKERFMNLRALAIAKRPELLPRPRGQLHWQVDVPEAERSKLVHEGDPVALSDYIDLNRAQLQEEARQRRLEAKTAMENESKSDLPMCNAEWLEWIDEHEAEFYAYLRQSTEKRQRLSSRLFVSNASSH